MADLQKTVEIIFGGRNDLSKTIGEVEKSLSSLNTATEPFANLAINALKAEAAIIGMGVAAAGLSIAAAGEFSGQFAEITTLIEGSADSLGDYRQAILDYAGDSTQSIDQITGALYAAISAGVDYEDSLAAIRVAEQLAVAGKADLGSTMVGLVSTLNAYGKGMEEAEDYADIFFTTVRLGQTTIPELNASLSQVTSIAAAAGVPFADLGAAIAALTAGGMPTSEAINAIRAALSNIIKPSSEAATLAEDLGIQFNSTALESMGLAGFLDMVWEATDGNIDAMAKLFGSVKGLTAVLSLAGDESGKFSSALDAMGDRAGAVDVAFAKMVDSFDLQNQKLANNVRLVLVSVGDQLLAGYGDIIAGLTANLQGVTAAVNAGSFDGLIDLFKGVMADIAKLLEGTAKTLPDAIAKIDWGNLTSSFGNLKTAIDSVMAAIFGDVDLTTIDGMAAGMQKFVDAIANLTNINAGIISALPGFFSAIVTVLEQISKLSPEQFELIGKGLGSALLLNVATDGISNVATTIAAFAVSAKALAGVSSAGLLAVATGLGSILALGASAGTGWAIGTLINDEIDKLVSRFSTTGADSLGAQFYDWIHGTGDKTPQKAAADLAAIDLNVTLPTFDNQSLIDSFNEIESTARQVAFETGKIPWELDADGNIAGTVTKITDSIESITKTADPEFENLKQSFIALGNSPRVADAMARIELETKRIPKALEDAVKETGTQSDALTIELAKIDSAFASQVLSLKVSLDIARLESETKIATAIIDTLNTTINSTGDLLGDLFGDRNSAKSLSDKWAIDSQIKDENKRRDDALKLQSELTKAQVDLLKARTDKLNKGDALITINGDGLAPELEAFMWKVLEAIQVRAADEESAFLLGI